MKVEIRTTLAALILSALPVAASAQGSETVNDYCNFLADYARAAAQDRDGGVDKGTAVLYAKAHGHDMGTTDLAEIAVFVHDYPRHEPEQEARLVFEECIEAYRVDSDEVGI